jgi:hypothetical protein
MLFGRILIAINVFLFVALAGATLIIPDTLFGALQVEMLSASAFIEMQVILAGSFIAFALVAGSGLFSDEKVMASLRRLALINGAWLVIRLISLIQITPDAPWTYYYLIYEAVMVLLLLLAFFINKQSASRKIFGNIDPTI